MLSGITDCNGRPNRVRFSIEALQHDELQRRRGGRGGIWIGFSVGMGMDLFIYCLFNDAVNNSDYMAPYYRIRAYKKGCVKK
jgi:hypothetical protein